MADGSVDIVIGTHALLAKGIRFSNLGLLIVDEEQRFGVSHKERLKEMRSDVHVLTLSATPIPRTLQMSLSGVRDLSMIGTPPVDRLAIRTYVSEFDAVTIREALLREHYRGGQSFYVVPRIEDLPEIEEFLREQVPEVSFVTAHGQMAAGELDDRMVAFYDGKYDVLLATTIVESGIDIPTANTMVIHRADMYGLAQLYQIRGRVGRSKTRAYAYLTTKPRVKLTPAAEKRLRVLGSLDSLGAGFTIASQDLDIRGAGNIVGEEQSGHVKEVGFELYQSMLEEAIARIRSGEAEGMPGDDGQWSHAESTLGVAGADPRGSYVPDLDVRLGALPAFVAAGDEGRSRRLSPPELIDRFGSLPREVNTLLLVVRIKAMCKRAHIARLDAGPKGGDGAVPHGQVSQPRRPRGLRAGAGRSCQGQGQQDHRAARLGQGCRQDQRGHSPSPATSPCRPRARRPERRARLLQKPCQRLARRCFPRFANRGQALLQEAWCVAQAISRGMNRNDQRADGGQKRRGQDSVASACRRKKLPRSARRAPRRRPSPAPP